MQSSQIKLSFAEAMAILTRDPSVRTLNASYKKGSNTVAGIVILNDSRSGLIFDSNDDRLKNQLNFVIREEWIDKYVSIYETVQEPPDIVFEESPAIVLKPETKVLVDDNTDSSKVSNQQQIFKSSPKSVAKHVSSESENISITKPVNEKSSRIPWWFKNCPINEKGMKRINSLYFKRGQNSWVNCKPTKKFNDGDTFALLAGDTENGFKVSNVGFVKKYLGTLDLKKEKVHNVHCYDVNFATGEESQISELNMLDLEEISTELRTQIDNITTKDDNKNAITPGGPTSYPIKKKEKKVTFSPQVQKFPDGFKSVECGKTHNDCFFHSVMFWLTGEKENGQLLKKLLTEYVVNNNELQTNSDSKARLGDILRQYILASDYFEDTYKIEDSLERMKEGNTEYATEQDIMLTIQAIRLGLLGSRCENISFLIWSEISGDWLLKDKSWLVEDKRSNEEVMYINQQDGHFQALVPESGFKPIYPELCDNIKFRLSKGHGNQKINSRKLSGKSSPCDEAKFSSVRWTDSSSGENHWSNAWTSKIRDDRTFDVHWCCDGTVDTYTLTDSKDPVLKPPEGNPIRHPEWKPTKSYLKYYKKSSHTESNTGANVSSARNLPHQNATVNYSFLGQGGSGAKVSSARNLPRQNATVDYSFLGQGGSGAYKDHLPQFWN